MERALIKEFILTIFLISSGLLLSESHRSYDVDFKPSDELPKYFTNTSAYQVIFPGPDLNLITSQIEESIQNGDTEKGMQHLTILGLHCGSVFTTVILLLKAQDADAEKISMFEDTIGDAIRMATTTLNAESVKQEMESRGSDIRDWFLTHMEAGTSAKAASLLNQENDQCVNIIFWLKDRL